MEPQHPVRSAGMEAHRARGVLSQNRSVTPEELLIVPNYSWGWQASVGSSSSTGGTSTLGVLTWLLRCAAYPFASLSCFLCLHLFSRRHEARDSLSHFVSSEKMSFVMCLLRVCFLFKAPNHGCVADATELHTLLGAGLLLPVVSLSLPEEFIEVVGGLGWGWWCCEGHLFWSSVWLYINLQVIAFLYTQNANNLVEVITRDVNCVVFLVRLTW